jgi:hypothetical protein
MKRSTVRAALAAAATLLSLATLPASARELRHSEGVATHTVARVYSPEIKATAQEVAQGLALAMGKREIRIQVRDAMRNSPWKEHRLVLQEFATTSAGDGLIKAASRSLNLSTEEFKASISSLPQLDFYVPFQYHRTTWKATPDLLVGTAFERHAPRINAYDVNGNPHVLLLADGAPATPLLILSPARRNVRRSDPMTGWSEVIQAAPLNSSGKMLVTCDNVEISCDGGGGGGGSLTPSGPGYYLTYFDIKGDDGWFDNSLELQFRSYYTIPGSGTVYQPNVVAIDGINGDLGYNVNLFLDGYRSYDTPSNAVLAVEIWEMDGGPNSLNPDDYYGIHEFPGGPANGVTYTYYTPEGVTTGYIQITSR